MDHSGHRYPLARTHEDLASGAAWKRSVLHVSVPKPIRWAKADAAHRILVLDGLGAGGLTIRMDRQAQPGPPLTKYAQKV